jgi:hypothetical protein
MNGDETYDLIVVSERITVVEVEPARPAVPHKLYEHFCDHPGCGKWGRSATAATRAGSRNGSALTIGMT